MKCFGKITEIKKFNNKVGIGVILEEDILLKLEKLKKAGVINAEVSIDDGRKITVEQRKKAYATMGDISNYLGYPPEELKELMKYKYCADTGEEYFSFSNCSITKAREFIDYLIKFVIEWEIPLSDLAINRTEDIDEYLYYCLKYRRCAITGQANADIHHCIGSVVGMGANRNKIDNRGRKLIALSREWHNKVHQEGEEKIFNLYKIYGIEIDIKTLKELGLNVNEIN